MANNKELRPSKAPNLPLGPVDYDQRFQDQMSNVLRLYFASVDNFAGALTGTDGGKYLQNPHIAAQDSTNQYAGGNDTPTIVHWNTTDSLSGFTRNLAGDAVCQAPAVYKIDFSLQFANTSNAQQDVYVWLQVDGYVVQGSSSKFTVPARKSPGVHGYVVAYSSITFPINAGDIVRLWWATSLAYNPVGPVDGVFMEALPAQTTPYARPTNPSAVGSIIFVSRLPS